MAIESNATVIFVSPAPAGFNAVLAELVRQHVLSDEDWDGPEADIDNLPPGISKLFGRDLGLDVAQAIIQAAKDAGVSVAVHIEYTNDYESELKGALHFYDKDNGRCAEWGATCNTMHPVFTLAEIADAFGSNASGAFERLKARYLPPADLLQAFGNILG